MGYKIDPKILQFEMFNAVIPGVLKVRAKKTLSAFTRLIHISVIFPIFFVYYSFDVVNDKPVNDLALLHLAQTVDPNQIRILPLCEYPQPPEAILGAFGMGSTSRNSLDFPETLQELRLKETHLISSADAFLPLIPCPESNICTNPLVPDASICHVDHGGPLYAYSCHLNTRICLYGVISYSMPDALYPHTHRSFFASIPAHFNWIMRTVQFAS